MKLARPAVVTSEPLYANNHPEHYAVSTKYPFSHNAERQNGAIRKSRNYDSSHTESIEYDTGSCILNGAHGPEPVSGLLLDAAGLSQKDLAISKKAEDQIIQERRDAELAKRLQEDLSFESNMDRRNIDAAKEAEDFEYARALQEKEELKLLRAKERSKQRRKQREMLHQQQPNNLIGNENQISTAEQLINRDHDQQEILHSRSESRIR